MRLTKLKLAGFKSFVDPTTLALPGQLVGVVGPNGCGKSNVIDAVRWVLGESKASELRGESMQDVIFNGSGARKAVSRASVELIFDNSLGRIAGQWSQYAELAVKRVLTRNGQSEYFINNLQVRRKDITDLFLGTGLGPRAYAIIGQGTISRVIEARPDELRVFLEEAAGVTKYKDRRKETEGRLADARENLARVEDVRAELGARMEHLEVQAVAAREYKDFEERKTRKQHLLWLFRRNEARAEHERLGKEIEAENNRLEGQIAALRETEARLEEAREHQSVMNEGVESANSARYEANIEVSRLEGEIRLRDELQKEYRNRLEQLRDDRSRRQREAGEAESDHARWRELLRLADERVEQAEMLLAARKEDSSLAEAAEAAARDEVGRWQGEAAEADKKRQVEIAHRDNARRSAHGLAAQRESLRREREAMPAPDDAEYESKREKLGELRERIAEAQEDVTRRQQELPDFDRQRREALDSAQQAQKERAEENARLVALEQLQRRVQSDGKLADWLRRRGIDARRPLWKSLHVEAGWENAVEAVLRERLNALPAETADPAWGDDRPGARLTLLLPREAAAKPGSDGLRARIRCDDAQLSAALDDWLDGVSTAPGLAAALEARENLAPGHCRVTPGGDVVTRQGVTLFAPDAAEHGVLERQREIEKLGETIAGLDERVEREQARLAETESRLTDAQDALEEARGALDRSKDEASVIEREALRLQQMIERLRERQAQTDARLEEIAVDEAEERERQFAAEQAIEEHDAKIAELRRSMSEARARLEEAGRALRDVRDRATRAEVDLVNARNSQRECRDKIEEAADKRKVALDEIGRIDQESAACEETAAARRAEDFEADLQAALERQTACEHALAAARDAQAEADGKAKELDEERQKINFAIDPLRKAIDDLKPRANAAEFNAAQYAAQLEEARADEAALAPELAGARPGALQKAIAELQASIEALGDVNLAALGELETARERKNALDAQSEDLTRAMETLESAIQRIDRETREKLRSTYDAVNKSFGELFPILFGGGEARLIMTGDEILDAGVEVMAQPPGKKNSTIHLLSGGEKALTAIALVFALFQLNPAPFCLLDEVDAPLDDTNTERFCAMVRRMSANTQFLFISHNKIAMEMAQQLVGVTMQESGVSRIVEVDMEEALRLREQIV
ncbi:MAG: chromosome segregation protein SMC [Candidatus Accumulibacter sp.]|jgi:chromosome segregation protein|nr:chromosome segregation protein SMC [Accumulibacter sp.]